jgi:apolipoprotein N-acyltransferase
VTQSSNAEIDRIIQSGQVAARETGPLKPVFLLCGLSLVLLWSCFTPVECAPAAWIALTPLCLLLRTPSLSRRQYLTITFCGWIWGVATLQWMRLGHPVMYLALVALGFYISLYFPVFIAVSRRLIRSGIPMWLVVPIVWTSLDFLRAWLMTGFAWYYLGHSQYRWTELIQIADITGVYGITFLTAMSAAVLSDFLPDGLLARPRFETPRLLSNRSRTTAAVTCAVLALAATIYGSQRQTPPDVTNGPVISLIQGYFPPEEKHDPQRQEKIRYEHDLLTRRAAESQPDLIVWPETMWPVADWIEDPELTEQQVMDAVTNLNLAPKSQTANILEYFRNGTNTREYLTTRSQQFGTSMLFGVVTRTASATGIAEFNSAVFVRPDSGYVGRYDKMHRVFFGEYTPLKSVFPALAKLRPPGMPELEAGVSPKSFRANGVNYAPAICFEDTVPRVIRRIVNYEASDADRPDVLVNMTNDAWFRGSSQLDQHLITSLFRCVETRRPMVRAVNGGISAFIDSSGRIRDPDNFLLMTAKGLDGEFRKADSMVDPATGRWYRNCSAVLTGQLPLDGRNTIYLQYGDWFAMLCSAATLALLIRSFVKSPQRTEDEQP